MNCRKCGKELDIDGKFKVVFCNSCNTTNKIEGDVVVNVATYSCYMCGHEWILRKPYSPQRCPKCGKRFRSQNVAGEPIELVLSVCNLCGYEWVPISGKMPIQCERCESKYWNVSVDESKRMRYMNACKRARKIGAKHV